MSWTGEKPYVGVSYGYDDSRYGVPIMEEGIDPPDAAAPRLQRARRRPESRRLAAVVSRHARREDYQHAELEGDEVGTTFHNDTLEGEVLLSHKRAGRLVGSFGGWFLNRDFEAIGEEALSPPVDQRAVAAFVYEEVESPHVTLQFGGRLDHRSSPGAGRRERTFNEWSASLGLC